MSDLPRGWASSKLVDLVAPDGIFCDGDWVESKDQDPEGDVRLTQLADVGVGAFRNRSARFMTSAKARALNCTFLERDDVLIARMPDPLGRACLFTQQSQPCVTVVDVAVLRPGRGSVDPRWLMWVINAPQFNALVEAESAGTTRRRISRRKLADLRLPVPPRPEQERIVAAIEEEFSRIDAGVAELVSARARLDALLRAVERSATLGLLVPQDDDDEPAPELLKRVHAFREKAMRQAGRAAVPALATDTSKLPTLPTTWAWASLDEVADVAGGVTKDQKKQGAPGTVEVPYLRVANVQRGRLDLTHVTTIRVPRHQAEALRLIPGDVLFNEGGDRDKLGRGWIWEGQIDNCVHQNHVFRARLYTDELDPRFVSTHGNSFGRLWFERMGKQTTNLASLNRTTLRSFPVPVPPAAEQLRIMNVLAAWTTAIRAAVDHVEAQTRRSSVLRSTVLAAAFSGSLVPQDHSDEPATSLLERFQGDRARTNGDQTDRSRRPPSTATA